MCANKAKTESNKNAYDRKGGRERKKLYTNACDKERKKGPQMPVAKKERTTNACGKERKNRPQMPVAKRTDHKRLWQRKKEQTTNAGGKLNMAVLTRQANR